MGLREKRSHVSGEMGMQSMTDIIFILLMFFMMISTLTAPSALPLSLPGKSSKNERMTEKRLPTVDIYADGTYQFNSRDVDTAAIRQSLLAELKGYTDPSKVNIIVAPSPKAPVEATVPIIDMITAMGANVVLDLDE